MSTEPYITSYELMPMPPVEKHTEYIDAGPLRIGIEFRLLTDAIVAANEFEAASGTDQAHKTEDLNDSGVSIHVFVRRGDTLQEQLRFDCFNEDPHYHYVCWENRKNEMVHLDPVADGDPVAWAIDRLRTRLPQMLTRAGAEDILDEFDQRQIDEALPRIIEAAYRARYRSSEEDILSGALKAS